MSEDRKTILVEIDRETTHVMLMSAQSLIYRDTGKKLTNNEVIQWAFEKAFGKENNENKWLGQLVGVLGQPFHNKQSGNNNSRSWTDV